MTPEEAIDQRIIKSRQHYHRYLAMIDGGILPVEDLLLFEQEILHLNLIADEYPAKAEKLRTLVANWKVLWGRVRGSMN